MVGRRGLIVVSGALLALALSGCASPTPTPTVEPTTATPTVEPTVEPTTPAQTEFFSMPEDCAAILPAATIEGFAADGIIILAGPGGKYGNELITDPTPEMNAGGISCYFGIDNEDPNQLAVTVLISAAPVDDSTRPQITADLLAQGLVQATDERGDATFGLLGGSAGQSTANFNVVAADSWISVISSKGGKKAYFNAVKLANDVHLANYN